MVTVATLLLFGSVLSAQTIDGIISSGEYGTHSDGQNQQTNGGQVTYMNWDENNLYVGVTGATLSEGFVMYLDKDPQIPVNGGANSNGTNVGQGYDNTNFAELPFRADLVIYVKNDYREYRTTNGSNGWSSATSGFGVYSESGTTREFSIPWSAIGSRPSAFNFFTYVTSSGGFVYGQVPTENGGGNIGTSARYERYYTVSTTAIGSSTPPFSRNSYVFNRTGDASGFGAISVYDFTMNSSGRTITRGSGAWTIDGNLRIDNGTVNFGATSDMATVAGNLDIGASGTLTLSSASGGDIKVRGTWTQGGTFNPSNRAVFFDAASGDQTISGATTFDYVILDKAAGNVVLSNDATVNQILTLTNGKIMLGDNNLTLGTSGSISGGSLTSYVQTNGTGTFRRPLGSSSAFFPVGNGSYNPVTLTGDQVSSVFGARVLDGVFANGLSGSSITADVVNRTWDVTVVSGSVGTLSMGVQWNGGEEGSGFNGSACYLSHYTDGGWQQTTAAMAGGSGPFTISRSGITSLSPFAVGSKGVLPISLTHFSATPKADRIELNWATASEQNNDYMAVEKSAEGWRWEEIGRVAGAGTTTLPQSYTLSDDKPLPGLNYYRLRQVDFDGRFEYHKTIAVDFKGGLSGSLHLFPSPAKDHLNVTLPAAAQQDSELWLLDAQGRVLQRRVVPQGGAQAVFEVSALPEGVYFVRMQGDVRSFRFVR
mgnify:FL=1